MTKPSETPRTGDWWCPTCKEALPWNRVTFHERCDTCGTPVHVAGEGEIARLERDLRAAQEELAALKAKIEAAGKELPEEPECLRLWHLGHYQAENPPSGFDHVLSHIIALRSHAEALAVQNSLTRTILAGTDISSLPNDFPLDGMVAERMKDLLNAHHELEQAEAALEQANAAVRDADVYLSERWPRFFGHETGPA